MRKKENSLWTQKSNFSSEKPLQTGIISIGIFWETNLLKEFKKAFVF